MQSWIHWSACTLASATYISVYTWIRGNRVAFIWHLPFYYRISKVNGNEDQGRSFISIQFSKTKELKEHIMFITILKYKSTIKWAIKINYVDFVFATRWQNKWQLKLNVIHTYDIVCLRCFSFRGHFEDISLLRNFTGQHLSWNTLEFQ